MSQQKTGAVTPSSLHEAIQNARRPFTAAAVKWKIQVNPKDDAGDRANATIVAFIDARLAGERLNAVGLAWSDEYQPVSGGMLCKISAVVDPATGETVTRSDVGWSRGTGEDITLKTLYSDAFKRAAVKWGVGVSIYALPMKRLYVKDAHVKKLGRNWFITDAGQKALTKHYEEWLKKVGVPQFGEPLDHGDVDGAQGDIESSDRQNDEAVAKDAPAPEAKPKPQAEKPAEKPAADKPISKEGVTALIGAFAKGTKTVEDVKTFLTSKGVEDPSFMSDLPAEGAFACLSADVGKQLHAWLRKSAA